MELCGTKTQEKLGFGYIEDACFLNFFIGLNGIC